MNINKNIHPYNEDNDQHGYWEMYYSTDSLAYKCFYNNGKLIGYDEDYLDIDGQLTSKTFYLK